MSFWKLCITYPQFLSEETYGDLVWNPESQEHIEEILAQAITKWNIKTILMEF